ncbi:MAG: hypothetical protein GEU28_05345 [Dehalococcoidia bacterium]|nr:hypothetical protein [Dehalococcoidia bacterium]
MSLIGKLGKGARVSFLVFWLVAVVLALMASSCGDDDDDGETGAEVNEETAEPTQDQPPATDTPAEEEPGDEPTVEETASEETATEEATGEFDEQAVADFYGGKTVTLLVGVGAGGGFDLQARLLAEYLGQYIPGNPTVIVENMPGAGSLISWNHMYNAGPKDGTLIGYNEGGQILQQALGNPAVEFDAEQVQYLGTLVQDEYLVLVARASGITRFDQILPPEPEEELTWGGIAAGSTGVDAPVILQDVLDANINLVTGYDSNSNIALAMDSGEIEGFLAALSSVQSVFAEQFENWNTIVALTEEPLDDLPDVPTVLEFAPDELAEQVITFGIIRPAQFARPLAVAPEVPEDRVLALSRAVEQALEDEEFLAAADQAGVPLDPLTREELQSLVEDFFGMPDEVRTRLQELLLQ